MEPTTKKPSATIWKFLINNIRGIEVFEYEFKEGKHVLVTYGDNGSAKSSIQDALYLALGGKSALPNKRLSSTDLVGPYSDPTKKIKRGSVDVWVMAEPGATELGENLWIQFGVTEKGTMTLKVTDTESGEVHTTSVREKVNKLLGLFLDPVKMVRTLEEYEGDKRLAEKVAEMAGIDFTPFVETETKLFADFQRENEEKTRQENAYKSLDKPQDDWATEWVDPAKISEQLQKFNEFTKRNEEKQRNIQAVITEKETARLENEKQTQSVFLANAAKENADKYFKEQNDTLSESIKTFSEFKELNKPEGWEDGDSVTKIEEEIARLTEKANKYRKYDKDLADKSKHIDILSERVESSKKSLEEKTIDLETKGKQKEEHDKLLVTLDEKIATVTEQNKPDEWDGEVDPKGEKEPFVYLSDRMKNVTLNNEQYQKRIDYKKAEEGLAAVEASLREIQRKRKENKLAKEMAVAKVKDKFPYPGITVDENTLYWDKGDRRGPRSVNTLSDGEKIFLCTHILIAANTGPLKLLIIRDGALLDKHNRKIIYDVSAEHGYKVILEAIETSEAGALHIVDGKVDRVNPDTELKESDQQEPVEEKQDDFGFNWG